MRVERVEVFVVHHRLRGWFRFFTTDASGQASRPSVLVKVTTDEGLVGWGEATPAPFWSYETVETVVTTLRDYLAPLLIGADPFDLYGIHEKMNRHIARSFSTGQPIAKAAVDLAFHDLIAKALNLPVAKLWGTRPMETVTLSWTIDVTGLGEEVERAVTNGKEQGYRHFNIKVGSDPKFDVDLVRVIRELVPDAVLWVDANGGYELSAALWVAPKFADLGVLALEQPLPPNALSGYQALRRQGALPIVMDESIVAPRDLLEFWRLGLLDGVAMKVGRMGGLLPARRCTEMLLDMGLLFLGSGLTDPPLSLAAHLHLFAAYRLPYPAALNGPQFLGLPDLYEGLKLEGDQALLPARSGLGVKIDEERLKEQDLEGIASMA